MSVNRIGGGDMHISHRYDVYAVAATICAITQDVRKRSFAEVAKGLACWRLTLDQGAPWTPIRVLHRDDHSADKGAVGPLA